MKLSDLEKEMDGGKNQVYPINDTQRINWIQLGHGVTALRGIAGKIKFSTNFEEQGHGEYEDVRKAIDDSIKNSSVCPKCGNGRQVWRNQITKRLTCHRYGCNNLEI